MRSPPPGPALCPSHPRGPLRGHAWGARERVNSAADRATDTVVPLSRALQAPSDLHSACMFPSVGRWRPAPGWHTAAVVSATMGHVDDGRLRRGGVLQSVAACRTSQYDAAVHEPTRSALQISALGKP